MTGQELQVRTQYRALVLHYNPHVLKDGHYMTVQEAYNYRNVDRLCGEYIEFLRKASGGQVVFSIADKFVLDEYPPDNDPNVTFTPENYDQYRSQGYDIGSHGHADYITICSDPRFQIVPKVQAGVVDVIWIFGPEGTGFWETAMAGQGAYWVNGGAYPEIDCTKKFVLFGFGAASHQGVGFMLENTAHMSEVIMNTRIAVSWPRSHRIVGWNTLNLNNPSRAQTPWDLNDWNYFTVGDSVHWDTQLVAPRHSQAGLSHFPPTACVNYGWSGIHLDFEAGWEADQFQCYDGSWSVQAGRLSATSGPINRTVLYGSHNLQDNLGSYQVPVIITDADVETAVTIGSAAPSALAGLLLRYSTYSTGVNKAKGYFVALNPSEDRLELAQLDGSYTVLATHPMRIFPGVSYPIKVSLRSDAVRVYLGASGTEVILATNLTAAIDGAIGFSSYNTAASFSYLYVTPVIENYAEGWRNYPDLATQAHSLSPTAWQGDGQPFSDMDYWYAWWYEHLPKNPGTHEVREPSTGALLGRVLNSWWPYIFDINKFDSPFLPNVAVASAPADTEAPETPGHLRGAGLSSTSIVFGWDEPVDNIGVTRYQVYRDGQLIRETPLKYFIDANLARETKYSYAVRARDGSGNVSAVSEPIELATSAAEVTLQNGDLESGLDSPLPWRSEAFISAVVFTWEAAGIGRNGTRCISIDAGTILNDAKWLQDVTGLVPFGRYLLSGWIKGQDIVLDAGASVGANLCAFGTWDHSNPSLSGTFDWTKVQLFVNASAEGTLTVGCRLGYWGNLAGGKAWFDDLTLEFAPLVLVPLEIWGANPGELATLPAGLSNAVSISAGDKHNLALKADGQVVAWGDNSYGQTLLPIGLSKVIGVAAGGSHSLAVNVDGSVVAWGNGLDGQTAVPAELTNALAVAAGTSFSLALRADGTVAAWGDKGWNQTNVPIGLTNVVAIDAGHHFALALRADGTVLAWGMFSGTNGGSSRAYVPEGLSNVVAIACGASHALALQSDGTVVAWGESSSGQADVPLGLAQVIAIAAGADHSLALKADGYVVGWGGNEFGQLTVPARVQDAFAIECGPYRSLALLGDAPPKFSVQPFALVSSDQTFRLTFSSNPGLSYFLLYRDSLQNSVWNVARGILASENVSLLADRIDLAQRFYTIRARPQR